MNRTRHQITAARIDHVEIYYPEDERRHWVVNPGAVADQVDRLDGHRGAEW